MTTESGCVMEIPSDLVTYADAARMVGVKRQSIWRAVSRKTLASYSVAGVPLVSMADVRNWARGRHKLAGRKKKAQDT